MIIAITNQKGGVGKTTTVLNIGVYLAVKGKRVLLIDIDPQANLSSGLGAKEDAKKNVYDYLINKTPVKEVITKTRIKNLDIMPSGIELAGAEVEMVNALSRETILKKGLDEVHKNYDFILIDCPPSLGLLTVNGLVAADKVIIPVQSEYFALEGLGQLLNTIKLIRTSLNPDMEIGGVIVTMYDNRTNLSKEVANEIENHFKDKVFKTIIPRSIRLSEAPSQGLSIHEYAPQSAGAIAYEELAGEIIRRFKYGLDELVRPNFKQKSA